jgi:hypothetical protein
MSKAHRIYIFILSAIVLITFSGILYYGLPYYRTSLEERFYNPADPILKPSGIWGHGMGIIGSLFIILGVSLYVVRKRMRSLARIGLLKNWLEFHIFLCTLGPILVLYHTSFKFGGLVAISFWSMVAVFLSGIIGRFIYIQIPRSIEGRELSLTEVKDMKLNMKELLTGFQKLDEESSNVILESTKKKVEVYHSNPFVRGLIKYKADSTMTSNVKSALRKSLLTWKEKRRIMAMVKNEISLNRKIDRLHTMQNLFKYWHVAHFPFAIVMLVIMIIHVAVTIIFGYKWIF